MLSCGRVIDELKDLWEQGVQIRDAVDNSVFNICAMALVEQSRLQSMPDL